MMLNIPEIPLKGSSSVATLSPKVLIKMGAKRTSIVLSVPPMKIMLNMKLSLDLERQAKILAAKSIMVKVTMVKGGPFLSARNPHPMLKIAELKIISISPTLMR